MTISLWKMRKAEIYSIWKHASFLASLISAFSQTKMLKVFSHWELCLLSTTVLYLDHILISSDCTEGFPVGSQGTSYDSLAHSMAEMIEFGHPVNHDLSPSCVVFCSTLPISLLSQLLDIRSPGSQEKNALKFGNCPGASQTFTAKCSLLACTSWVISQLEKQRELWLTMKLSGTRKIAWAW